MPGVIDEAEVRRVARLARLKLSDAEVHLFTAQLARILEYVRQLEEVDTTGVEPLVHALPVTNALRNDEPRQPLDAETALRNAPERAGDFFKVPAILDPSAGT